MPRNITIVEYRGQRYTLRRLARKTGVPEPTIRLRLSRGWTVEQAVNPANKHQRWPVKQEAAE